MKSQHTQSAYGQGDWDRSRNEQDPRNASEQGRPYPRSGPEHYPESHQQYQAQRDHPGSEYFSGSPGYGGRGDYAQQQQGQGGYGSHQQGYGSQQQGYGGQQSGYGGGSWSRSEAERGQGGYRQQEAFQPSGGRQQGYGGEDSGRGGYGREEQGQQYGHPQQGYGQYGGQSPGYGGVRQDDQTRGQGAAGQASHFGGHYPEHIPGESGQGYRGFQTGQPQSYGASEHGEFMARSGYPSGGQPSGGYGSYGAYQVGTMPAQGRTPRAPKDYQRSDERIRELICENLAHHPGLDASEVSVQVSQGRVSLEGTVPMRRMKHEIEDVADACWGVKDVENRIRVQSMDERATPGTNNPARGVGEATADLITGGASTQAGQGMSAAELSPTETGSAAAMASSRKTAGTESKSKG
ncbi:MAG TPA: BON domain-containing protein [Rhodocyclaceae bacterium]|nr:BON domain-containing protein [Rhodocyclaceae bacterium]